MTKLEYPHQEIETQRNSSIPEHVRQIFGETNKDSENDNVELRSSVDGFLESKLLPRTYRLTSPNEVLPDDLRKIVESTGYIDKKDKSNALVVLSSLLLNRRLDKHKIESELRDAFKNKTVLVLGDDIGGLSEIINALGGRACGIEYSAQKVRIAHSGVLAENQEPQTQVMQGDILDLCIDSELLKKLKEIGPFDAIVSDGVFNGGSGIDDAKRALSKIDKSMRLMAKLLDKTDSLLKDDGIQLHMEVDDIGSFLSGGTFPSSAILGGINKDILEKYGTDFKPPGLDSPYGHLLTRKGLIEKLREADPRAISA